MTKLTKQQISQQDFVDNQIFELIQKLLPSSKKIDWDIEIIGAIRDAISKQIVKKNFMSEMQFYPYLKI
ncbi:MAG: hypothetical protein A3H42_06235 [Deltaproteobacteria bacterium RIFCSPLOWO2_02_FULL_46_8]|nr:MAG: hypothetical protein A3H42_06235 [Deltaproteobacteria bacterium RIFCSPLOWO2_02_FULL_46_8]